MKTENLSILKINELTQKQFDKALKEGRINDDEIYLTPDEEIYYVIPEVTDKDGSKIVTLSVEDGIFYKIETPINQLTITYPDGNFICSFSFTLADDGSATVEVPNTSKYIGGVPTFAKGETWELNIRNGVVVGGVVVGGLIE